ncbi:hypothetical protein [Tsukamurella ocularis]|uniref:hypothetical protein n=1 Tax=Tsukamurella ocularis TaxID=1970234 RepID=UPI002166FFAA|nr:hypothetical protein [Tsukamurella ocularis]MCS3778478.1 hypothetical protein [Tsukamurella ocularis]MCS3789179.1 hypothetical protein [Tsukamurella ocularis]MCS3853030.1 hypothetical protein [Tsukamurella ocularis]
MGAKSHDRITDIFRLALGADAKDVARGRCLGPAEVDALRDWHAEWSADTDSFDNPSNEIWPLVSHHTDSVATLRNFGLSPARASADPPILELQSHLAACNGIVLADPLRRVFYDVKGEPILKPDPEFIRRAAGSIAQIDPLISADVVRVSRVHPVLESSERQKWIVPFNLGDGMETLLAVIEQGYWKESHPHEVPFFDYNASILMEVCGMRPADFPTGISRLQQVDAFARALMEVSWQLANVVETNADLYLTNKIELRILEVRTEAIIDELGEEHALTDSPFGEGRHLQTLATVGIPRFSPEKITFRDLIDIRSSDEFTLWRNTLNVALDTYSAELDRSGPKRASHVFGSQIRSASDELNRRAKAASWKTAVNVGAPAVGLTTTATGLSAAISGSPVWGAVTGIALLSAASGELFKYFRGRSAGRCAAVRFIAAFDL